VVPRANELFGWGWNGFGELGTGDELPRLSPVQIESVLPASCAKVAAGSHHTLILTSGYAVTCREDGQRPFKGYAPHVKAYEELYAAEAVADERRLQNLSYTEDDDDDAAATVDGGSKGGSGGAAGGLGSGGLGRPSTTVGPGGRPKLSKIGELTLKATSEPLRRVMEYARLHSTLLEAPAALVPDQLGLEHNTPHASGGGGGDDDDASLGGSSVGDGSLREAGGVSGHRRGQQARRAAAKPSAPCRGSRGSGSRKKRWRRGTFRWARTV
jgi:hypothetical protein